MSELETALTRAVDAGQLLPSSRANILALLAGSASPVAAASIDELVAGGEWQELNDRFFKSLAFGTGGLRGRTIGRVVTKAEQGAGGPNGRPEHPCAGTASMNFYNVSRAVRGLVTYARSQVGDSRRPALVFAHDTRHFSRDFAEFCAKTAADLGCDAYLFDGPRSTPQLSFAIRELRADAGAVITASHNPPHDNGFKAYFNDGAQIVDPHASGIIAEVNAIRSERYDPLPEDQRGSVTILGTEMDELYTERLKSLLLRPALLDGASTRVVFTSLHGTGGHIILFIYLSLYTDSARIGAVAGKISEQFWTPLNAFIIYLITQGKAAGIAMSAAFRFRQPARRAACLFVGDMAAMERMRAGPRRSGRLPLALDVNSRYSGRSSAWSSWVWRARGTKGLL